MLVAKHSASNVIHDFALALVAGTVIVARSSMVSARQIEKEMKNRSK